MLFLVLALLVLVRPLKKNLVRFLDLLRVNVVVTVVILVLVLFLVPVLVQLTLHVSQSTAASKCVLPDTTASKHCRAFHGSRNRRQQATGLPMWCKIISNS